MRQESTVGGSAREPSLQGGPPAGVYADEGHMDVIRSGFTAEAGAVLQRALEAAEDALYQQPCQPLYQRS